MKNIITLFLLLITTICNSQTLVIDPAVISTLTVSHIQQKQVFEEIEEKEKGIRNLQVLIQVEMQKINRLQEKTYNYLKTAQAVVRNGKDIIYASQLAREIARYQSEAFNLAVGDPELLLVCAKTEYELISRSADLMLYIYDIALNNGEHNLLDNKQRIDLCIHVVSELRTMRGLAYSVCRQMKSAKRYGLIRALSPRTFRYVRNGQMLANNILRDIRFITNN